MKKFEDLKAPKFNRLDVEKMKRLKGGGYTSGMVTRYAHKPAEKDAEASIDD